MASSSPMRTVAMRSLLAHKVRFLLTILAVLLGTAFVASSFMLTNSLSKTFNSLVDEELADVSAVVLPAETNPDGLSVQDVGRIREMPGVGHVNINQDHPVIVANSNDEALQTGGAPSSISPFYPPGESVRALDIVDGAAPHGAHEVLLNKGAAKDHGIHVGDTVKVVDRSRQESVTVTGIYDTPSETGGYIGVLMEAPAFVEQWTNGHLEQGVMVSAAEGTSQEQLIEQLRQAYPNDQVKTGQEMADEISAQISKALSFVNYFLVAFGLIALVVGTFIIANTFAMIVAQRLREFALLRSLGVSQGQVTRSVVGEALVVGIVGSLLGVLAGVGLVHAIYAVMDATGFGLPAGGVALSVSSVLVPLVLGTLVTVISAWAPARRAGAVKPVEAMRSGDSSSASSLVLRTVVGIIGIVGGIACAVAAALLLDDWSTAGRAIVVGLGALALIVGTFLASPALSIPIVPGIGRVVGLPFGAIGRLAATNSKRNPRRSATTAFALTLGVALVTSFGMLGATMKSTVADVTESTIQSAYMITGASSTGGEFPLSEQIADAAADVDGVQSVAALGIAPVTVAGMDNAGAISAGVTSFYQGDIVRSVGLNLVEGSADSTHPGLLVEKKFAAEHGWAMGDTLEMGVPGTPFTHPVSVTGFYESNDLLGTFLLSEQSVKDFANEAGGSAAVNKKALLAIFVNSDPSVSGTSDMEALKQRLVDAVKPFIVAQVVTPQEYAGQQAVMIDQMLSVLYALLALSIVVAVLGIINTLALNVIERRQEIGMLRAVGTHRGQVRRMITLEAVQIALYGAVIGVAVGLILGWAFIKVLAGEGLGTVTYPWMTILGMLVGAALVGVVAAVWPAVKASRTPPLEAIAD
ncbi:ABC transporter permease [Corynebacterium sp. 320]|uniref:ABC transporter permease n=1 Tax=Corynebacterium TaxID=1716 RepID=UPI00125CA8D8|nr:MULTISPECIES: ABC transporter permease [Corynebacterium]KAB1501348.1 ABC transporter permease [Corynebacterium sp. 320]KAB1551517.1 ABC transporter permease [Corynebacterium sp. 321]KAB1551655.1 ABC transporter permease [Corynebacterium sp. 319]KAB3525713.1 ABC transporter permease [Corynebacterium sp. 250]KAB3538645.1 ABC transporter permease [Corynebacterium sp. 366]